MCAPGVLDVINEVVPLSRVRELAIVWSRGPRRMRMRSLELQMALLAFLPRPKKCNVRIEDKGNQK